LKEVGQEEGGDYAAALRSINRMVDQGRSWSGNERNYCYLNTGQRRFANVSAASGFDFLDDARALAEVDWDHDGDLDLFVTNRTAPTLRYLRNDYPRLGHWLILQLEGTTSNRDAIGARVQLHTAGVRQVDVRTVYAGNSFLSQSSKAVHFGLGERTDVDEVTVAWPGGPAEVFRGMRADRRYRLVQGTGKAVELPSRDAVPAAAPSVPAVPAVTEQARIVLYPRLPLPPLNYESLGTQPTPLTWNWPTETAAPTLVQLWASWCPHCQAEMLEFVRREPELQQSGLKIVALSVDGIGTDQGSVVEAIAAVHDRQYPFATGHATERLLQMFEALRGELFSHEQPYPLPTSFLIDAQGQVSVIYVGPLTVDQLLADVTEVLPASQESLRVRSVPLAGRWMTPAAPLRYKPIADALREHGLDYEADWYQQKAAPQMALSHCQLAIEAERRSDLATASGHLRAALGLAPDSAAVRAAIGDYHLRRNDAQAGREHLAAAVELEPAVADYHVKLATVDVLTGQWDAAEAGLRRALELDGQSARAHTALARLLQRQKNWDAAAEHLQQALAADPKLAPAHVYLGVIRTQQQRLADAEASFRAALTLAPELRDAQENLANVLMAQRKTGEAIAAFRVALRLNPQSHAAAMKLAWCLATAADQRLRSGPEALRWATAVVKATGGSSPHSYDVLAAAYAENGQFPQAVAAAKRAVSMAERARLPVAQVFRQRLALYEQQRPFRETQP
jgi:tetratricopeptide (TPR) repeat protein/peroxiredoxin